MVKCPRALSQAGRVQGEAYEKRKRKLLGLRGIRGLRAIRGLDLRARHSPVVESVRRPVFGVIALVMAADKRALDELDALFRAVPAQATSTSGSRPKKKLRPGDTRAHTTSSVRGEQLLLLFLLVLSQFRKNMLVELR